MPITLDGTTGIITPALGGGGPVSGSTGSFTGAVTAPTGTFTVLKANGLSQAVFPMISEITKPATGTVVEFLNIPTDWARRITLHFSGVSTTGTSPLLIQMGGFTGYETSGYLGGTEYLAGGAAAATVLTAGINVDGPANATYILATSIRHGSINIGSMGGQLFSFSGMSGQSQTGVISLVAGSKQMNGQAFDKLRIMATNGTDTFDAGAFSLMCD